MLLYLYLNCLKVLSFLFFQFNDYNSNQCKRDGYDKFLKITSQDAKQVALRSVLDTSEMRSNIIATINNATSSVMTAQTFNDVDQCIRTVGYTLKTNLKHTIGNLIDKVKPLAKNFLDTAENLKKIYQKGSQSTYKMLSSILISEITIPTLAIDTLKLISPEFDVDKLIDNILKTTSSRISLKKKKANAHTKLTNLSKYMDLAISNIDCFILSTMSTIGTGADVLKSLRTGRMIMTDKHPRAKELRNAMGIIKSGKKITDNINFTPLTSNDIAVDEDDDEEDPDQVEKNNEEFFKTIPNLEHNASILKEATNRKQTLGVISVYSNKQIKYKEVNDTLELKKFVMEETKKYRFKPKEEQPKFLKVNSKKVIDTMVEDVKRKAEKNGMSRKEMVDEIIKSLSS